jgi:hypothetical protein
VHFLASSSDIWLEFGGPRRGISLISFTLRYRECGRLGRGGDSPDCWELCECAGEPVPQILAGDHCREGSMATTK